MSKKKPNDYGTGIPPHEVEALARILLPEMQAFLRGRKGSGSMQSGRPNIKRRKTQNKPQDGSILPMLPPWSSFTQTGSYRTNR